MNKLDRLLIGTKKLVYDIQSYEDNSHLSKEIEEVLEHPEALDWGENDSNIGGDCIDGTQKAIEAVQPGGSAPSLGPCG